MWISMGFARWSRFLFEKYSINSNYDDIEKIDILRKIGEDYNLFKEPSFDWSIDDILKSLKCLNQSNIL